MKTPLMRSIMTMLIAAFGALLFYVLSLPLPFLLGPLFACLGAALARVSLQGTGPVGTVMRTILGVAVGASITPDIVHRVSDIGFSLVLVPLLIICVGSAGYFAFRRLYGFDHATAYYSAMPGGLQDMLLFGEEAGGNVRTLSLIHATRVLIIVSTVPLVLYFFWGLKTTSVAGQAASEVPLIELALMTAAGIGGWQLAAAVGMFGASILGPLIATAALSLSGFIEHRPPVEAIICAQYFIGLTVGVKYTGITWLELRRDVSAGALLSVLIIPIGLVFATVSTLAGAAPPLEAFLAFSPGGQAEMAVLAIITGADLPFVVTHHLMRMILVIAGSPIVAKFTMPWGQSKSSVE